MKAEPVRLACFNPSFVVDLKKESKPPPKKKKTFLHTRYYILQYIYSVKLYYENIILIISLVDMRLCFSHAQYITITAQKRIKRKRQGGEERRRGMLLE